MGCWGGPGRGALGGAGRVVGGPVQPGRTLIAGAMVLGAVLFTMGNCGGVLLFVSHVPMSMLCLPGTIGPGGIPGPFFFSPWFCTVSWGLAGWLAMLAQVVFFAWPRGSLDDSDDDFMSERRRVRNVKIGASVSATYSRLG
jgi:hypothetical protein